MLTLKDTLELTQSGSELLALWGKLVAKDPNFEAIDRDDVIEALAMAEIALRRAHLDIAAENGVGPRLLETVGAPGD